MTTSKNIITVSENTKGRDFFVGDIHGCYDLFLYHLNQINFNFLTDRMFSVGDLTDRGPSSEECVRLITEGWFYAVRGNHEDMCIGVHRGGWPENNFISNGGQWFTNLKSFPDRQERIVQLMEELPLLIEVPYKGKKIGVLHADAVVDSWNDYREDFNQESVIWGRMRVFDDTWDTCRVADIDAVVVGHTPVKKILVSANVVYIDTGAVFGKGLTIIEASEVLRLVESNNAKT